MKLDIKNLPDTKEELKEVVIDLNKIVIDLNEEKNTLLSKYIIMKDNFTLLQNSVYGKKSEKLPKEDDGPSLFNEAETDCDVEKIKNEIIEDAVEVKSYKRKKQGRKPIPESIPRKIIVHDLSEEEKKCACCGKERPLIGEEVIGERLDIIPAEIYVKKTVVRKYGACKCRESVTAGEMAVISAKAPKNILPGSIASAGFLSYVVTSKFVDALPFYRVEKICSRHGVEVSRMNMCNWTISLGHACGDLLKLFWKRALSGSFIQMDETVVQVLRETGRSPTTKSYMWVTIGYDNDNPIIIYSYYPSRSKDIPSKMLFDYKGYLQTDGYAGYKEIGSSEYIIHVGCFAHDRRYFINAKKLNKKNKSIDVALNYIKKIYRIEKELRNNLNTGIISKEEFVSSRKKATIPIFDDFHKWLVKKQLEVVPQSKFGEAINYTLNEWNKLIKYVEDASMTPDNNYCENKIRPFVIGRKNWLFNVTPLGAHASACLYSLVETAKANGLEPYRYLRYIFTKIPLVKSQDDLEKLLPYNLTIEELFTV